MHLAVLACQLAEIVRSDATLQHRVRPLQRSLEELPGIVAVDLEAFLERARVAARRQ
jgi:hypothetical protein